MLASSLRPFGGTGATKSVGVFVEINYLLPGL
jgi:hypothetical protein